MLAAVVRAGGGSPQVGEYAAACVAGVLTLEERPGSRCVDGPCRRCRRRRHGGDRDRRDAVRKRLAAWRTLWPSPPSTPTRSSRRRYRASLDALLNELGVSESDRRWLVVSHAFHSPLMQPMLEAFEAEAASVTYAPPRIPFVSNLTGEAIERLDARYWRQHAALPVRFADGITSMAAMGCSVFVEIGPTPALLPLARRCLERATGAGAQTISWVPTLRRGRGDTEQIVKAIGALYVAGASIDWRAVAGNVRRRPVTLPTYPFARERHWFDAMPAGHRGQTRAEQAADAPRTLLGTRVMHG